MESQAIRAKQYIGSTAGIILIAIGVPGLVLPILQGWLFIAIGTVLLSMFCPPVGRRVAKVKGRYPFAALYIDRAEDQVEQFFRRTHRRKRIKIMLPNGKRLCAIYDECKRDSRGIAVILHGLGGYKEQPLVRALGDSVADIGYSTLRFDTQNGVGESDGRYSFATTTGMLSDLSDVMEYVKALSAFNEQGVILMGHSLGGLCVLEYTAQHPSRVSVVVVAGPVISGALSKQAIVEFRPDEWESWQRAGHRADQVATREPYNRLPFTHIVDRMEYDMLPKATLLSMPVLLLVGEKDENTPLSHVRQLLERLPEGKGELVVLPGAAHTINTHADVALVKASIRRFIEEYFNPSV